RQSGGDRRGYLLHNIEPKNPGSRPPRVPFFPPPFLRGVETPAPPATARPRGSPPPAAGKTGTSHDGWFAGFTSNLLCVVWVGFDDNRELGLSGSSSAAPIWAEFMKRAVTLPAYRSLRNFSPPEGVVSVTIDPETLQLATPNCPTTREEVYVRGTEATEFCERHGGRMFTGVPPASWLSRLFGGNKSAASPASAGQKAAGDAGRENGASASSLPEAETQPGQAQSGKNDRKKGVLNRILGIFGGGKKDQEKGKPGPRESP